MTGRIIGAIVGLILVHSVWGFVVWNLWPWTDIAEWDMGGRFWLLYTIFCSVGIGGLIGSYISWRLE